jgi:pilus assembly protein Flp/PilA
MFHTHKTDKSVEKENSMSRMLLQLHVKFVDLANSEEGQDMVEYGLLVALIALVCISSIDGLATAVQTAFGEISGSLASA